jgi:hypothetical protein
LFIVLPWHEAGGEDRAMPHPHKSNVARIGRSYPRATAPDPAAARPPGLRRRYQVMAGLVAVLSALGLIGWLLAR